MAPMRFGVNVGKLAEFVGDLHEVFKYLATMVARDFRREILAIAGGAMRIGESDDVAHAGVDLPVAAKRILPLKLRSTVHVEDEGIFPGRIEVVGLDNKDFNLRAVGALNPYTLGGTEVYLLGDFVVELREALRRRGFAVSQVHRKNLDRIADGTPGVDDAVGVMAKARRNRWSGPRALAGWSRTREPRGRWDCRLPAERSK